MIFKKQEGVEKSISPLMFTNWQSQRKGKAEKQVFEVQLYSDAEYSGEIDTSSGCPYDLLSVVSMGYEGKMRHALTLRVHLYQDDMTRIDGIFKTGSRNLVKETTSLISLLTGTRIHSGSITRVFNSLNPLGTPHTENEAPVYGAYVKKFMLRIPKAVNQHDLNHRLSPLFNTFPLLEANQATALVKTAKLYKDAMWICESEPSIAWLFLVSAIETLAVLEQVENTSSIDILKRSHPELIKRLNLTGDKNLAADVAEILHEFLRSTGRFVDFLLKFWIRKPNNDVTSHKNQKQLKKIFSQIYKHRSDSLHAGIPFPLGYSRPSELMQKVIQEDGRLSLDTAEGKISVEDPPMQLSIFEEIVRSSIINWWRSVVPEKTEEA